MTSYIILSNEIRVVFFTGPMVGILHSSFYSNQALWRSALLCAFVDQRSDAFSGVLGEGYPCLVLYVLVLR